MNPGDPLGSPFNKVRAFSILAYVLEPVISENRASRAGDFPPRAQVAVCDPPLQPGLRRGASRRLLVFLVEFRILGNPSVRHRKVWGGDFGLCSLEAAVVHASLQLRISRSGLGGHRTICPLVHDDFPNLTATTTCQNKTLPPSCRQDMLHRLKFVLEKEGAPCSGPCHEPQKHLKVCPLAGCFLLASSKKSELL